MTKTQQIALACLLLSCGFSVLLTISLERTAPDLMMDFKESFSRRDACFNTQTPTSQASRCAFIWQKEQTNRCPRPTPTDFDKDLYLPTTSIFIAPFAMLPWGPAHLLWMILTAIASSLLAT